MSQSDYIQFLKTTNELKINKLPPQLSSDNYTSYSQYSIEKNGSNTKNAYSQLIPTNKKNILGMELNVANCASFTMCNNTNARPNRVLNTEENIILNGGVRVPYKPNPTYRLNKVYTPSTCIFNYDYTVRKPVCAKKVCKCKTQYLTK